MHYCSALVAGSICVGARCVATEMESKKIDSKGNGERGHKTLEKKVGSLAQNLNLEIEVENRDLFCTPYR